MPRATFTHQATAPAPIEEVWQRLQDADTWAGIGPVDRVWDPEHDSSGTLRTFRWGANVALRNYEGTATVTEMVPGEMMHLDLDAREIVGSLTTRLGRNGADGTTVTVTLEVVARGTLSTLFFPIVSESIARGLPEQVDRFAASL